MGHTKYDAIEEYLNIVCPQEKYLKYNEESTKASRLPYEEFVKKDKELKKKYGIVLLDDVLYNEKEGKKFNDWFENRISPFNILDHGKDNYSLFVFESSFSDLFSRRKVKSGYDFEKQIQDYVDDVLPHLNNSLTYDSEAGMFCVYSNDIRNLEELAYSFKNSLMGKNKEHDINI